MRSRPSKRAGAVDALADGGERGVAAGGAAEQCGAQGGGAVRAGGERHRRQRRRRRARKAHASRATLCRTCAAPAATGRRPFELSDATLLPASPVVSARRTLFAGAGRRGRSPAMSAAAMREPADVPTSDSVVRKSCPVASSMPARTPLIQASPSVPPLASTSTSGRRKGASATSDRAYPRAVASRPATQLSEVDDVGSSGISSSVVARRPRSGGSNGLDVFSYLSKIAVERSRPRVVNASMT